MTKVTDQQEGSFNYNLHIKRNLCAWKDRYETQLGVKLSYASIARRIEDEFFVETSPQKIAALFNITDNREAKLSDVVAICQLYSIPLHTIVDFPSSAAHEDVTTVPVAKRTKTNEPGIVPLSNAYYLGDYYVYYFKPKLVRPTIHPLTDRELMEGHLNIKIQNGQTIVTLTEIRKETEFDFFHNNPLPSFQLTGKLYVLEPNNIAYAFISDPSGRRAMSIFFQYLDLSADIRYYLTAGILTLSLHQVHEPVFQKMAVFKVRQDLSNKEQEQLIRGILALNSAPILLEESTISRLRDESPIFESLLCKDRALTSATAYSEEVISAFLSMKNDITPSEKMETILRLRRESLLQAHEIVSESDVFADFIKAYQQNQLFSSDD